MVTVTNDRVTDQAENNEENKEWEEKKKS